MSRHYFRSKLSKKTDDMSTPSGTPETEERKQKIHSKIPQEIKDTKEQVVKAEPGKASPLSILQGWTKRQQNENTIHFNHPKHGVISLVRQGGIDALGQPSSSWTVRHYGKVVGNKQFGTMHEAANHMLQHISALDAPSVSGTVTLPQQLKRSEYFSGKLEELSKARKVDVNKATSLKSLPKVPSKQNQNKKATARLHADITAEYKPLKQKAMYAMVRLSGKDVNFNEVYPKGHKQAGQPKGLLKSLGGPENARKIKADWEAVDSNGVKNSDKILSFLTDKNNQYLTEDVHERAEGRLSYRINHFKMVGDIAGRLHQADPSRFKPMLTMANGKTAKHGVATFDMLPQVSCPQKGVCAHTCYVDSAARLEPKVVTMGINYYATHNPDFVPEMDQLIKGLKNYKPTGKNAAGKGADWSKDFRIHASGDFYTPEYINKWEQIIAANPQTNIGAYTKSYADLAMRKLLFRMHDKHKNFCMRQSVGSNANKNLDERYPIAVVCENLEQLENGVKAGMTFCGSRTSKGAKKAHPLDIVTDDDRQAYNKNIHTILLKDHYQKKGVHNLGQHCKGLPRALHDKLVNALMFGIKKSEGSLEQLDPPQQPTQQFDITDHCSQPDEFEQINTETFQRFHHHMRTHKRRA